MNERVLPVWVWTLIGAVVGVLGSYAAATVWMYRAYTSSGRWQ